MQVQDETPRTNDTTDVQDEEARARKEQRRKNQAAIELLESWATGDDEDERDQRETWEFLRTALNEDRLSDRDRVP